MNRLRCAARTGVFCFLWTFLLSGCEQKTFDNLDEMDAHFRAKDSPYVQTVVRNGITVTARYMPTAAMMIPLLKRYEEKKTAVSTDTTLSQTMRDSLLNIAQNRLDAQRRIYDRSLYIALTIGFEDGQRDIVYQSMQSGFGNYSEWLQKLMFRLKEQFFLRTKSGEEIPLDAYHLDRTYGMTKDRTLLLMFPAVFNNRELLSENSSPVELVLKEFGLGVGRLKFEFDAAAPKTAFRL